MTSERLNALQDGQELIYKYSTTITGVHQTTACSECFRPLLFLVVWLGSHGKVGSGYRLLIK